MKILLAVDGSEPSLRATRKLIDTLVWYREPPQIEIVNVHLAVPHVGGMHTIISEKDIDRYYADESAANVAAAVRLLQDAGVQHTVRTLVGPIGETIAKHARDTHADLVYLGTHGRRAALAIVMGSVAMDVVQHATVPVVLIR